MATAKPAARTVAWTPGKDPGGVYGATKYWRDEEVTLAVDALEAGGLVLLKGDIGYGLFGTTDRAIYKMYELKGRPHSNPCIVIGNLAILRDIARAPDPRIWPWIERAAAWTTLAVVLPINPDSRLLKNLPPWLYGQTVTNGTVAAFLRTGPYLDVVVQTAYERGVMFVGSSANPSFQGNLYTFADLPRAFVDNADFYLDHGSCRYANPARLATTIINFANRSIKRRGVNAEQLERDFAALNQELAY
ncbi:MAG TPA: Sua5/YciO/YrdC/YwlC family protein [Kofleriaceae bacterium]|nr:Sua5/YciO/YrdC/YwlC family protein [Kofleriaceae bacterium]